MRDLTRLLQPQTIAIVGGGSWAQNVQAQCRALGFPGQIWHVHPTAGDAAKVTDLPHAPDAAFIGVNRHASIHVVGDLAEMGAGGAVCFASGFSEAAQEDANATDLQHDLLCAAKDMPIIGPNCYGVLNYLDGAALWPDQQGGQRVERGVAVITQSSNIALNLTMQRRGLPLAYVLTAGNQAQTGLSQLGRAVLNDPRVTALGLHIEGIDDLANFQNMAHHAAKLGKPIVALKVGASAQAQQATISHTASLAGSDAGARALLRRLGIGQVTSLAVLIEALKILHVTGPLASHRIASLSCSGGEASLMADLGQMAGVDFPPLTTTQTGNLRTALGPMVALANPLDYHTYIWNDQDAMTRTFTAMMGADLALGVLVLDFPRGDRCTAHEWDQAIEAAAKTHHATGRPMAILSTLPETMPEQVAQQLIQRGLIPLSGMTEGLEAVHACATLSPPTTMPVVTPRPVHAPRTLDEAQAKSKLAQYGLRLPRSVVTGRDDLARKAAQIGFPVVLKGLGIAHKTEAGAVALHLPDAQAVAQAAHAMPCTQFLIEEMITGAIAELLIGVTRDPAHGHVLTLGAGGVMTEILRDTQSLLLPVTRDDVKTALAALQIAPVLLGYRGAKPAQIDAIVDAVMVLQRAVLENPAPVDEAEINPLICTATDAIAVDALIREGTTDD